MMISTATLSVIKVCSSVLAGLYGIYATLTDFHEIHRGKKRLTDRGRLGLLILFAATVTGITSDGFKEQQDRARSDQDDRHRETETQKLLQITKGLESQLEIAKGTQQGLEKTQRGLQLTSKLSAETLVTSQRLLDPIPSVMRISAMFQLPVDQANLKSYADKIRGTSSLPYIKFGDKDFPSEEHGPGTLGESFFYHFVTGSQMYLSFYRNLPLTETRKPNLSFHFSCQPPYDSQHSAQVQYYGGLSQRGNVLYLGDSKNIYFECDAQTQSSRDDSTFYSVDDLRGANVELGVHVDGQVPISPNKYVPYLEFSLRDLSIAIPGGRRLVVEKFRRISCLGLDTVCFRGSVELKGISN